MTLPVPLLAHAFGGSYVLPLPLWLYLYAAAAAIVLSFIIIALIDSQSRTATAPEHPLATGAGLRITRAVLAVIGLAFAALLIATGFAGAQMPLINFSITGFWILLLLALTYLTALIAGLWDSLNPAATIYRLIEPITPEPIEYPDWLSYWPAVAGYFGLIWLELLSHGFGTIPRNLAALIVVYGVVMIFGQVVFGPLWLKRADFFTVFFAQVGRIAPFRLAYDGLILRRPFAGLLARVGSISLVSFIVFMLASTAYDGFRETVAFGNLYNGIISIPGVGNASPDFVQFIMLLGVWAFFLALFTACMAAMKAIAELKLSLVELAKLFAASLIPIAVAYNAAHYYTLLLTQGQSFIPLASDPFGFGWNLFGTAGYRINVGILPATFIWYSQVALILIGHIAGVYIAHCQALQTIPDQRKAVLSQYPMLMLMVIYTVTSLWIIAQPLALPR